ncbi:7234_t:CDS:2 [Funneliformis mosseae]|uniref:7234_t:CDS:1 n=1 Tax=Funneliformis mosseae TaxID=27381 RepID=A0A9N9FH05_FUNMO|nr:7234_t:CDS:2 [Funneliformis mosseae]
MSLGSLALIYVFGGLTFFPFLGAIILIIIFPPWTWKLQKNETIKFDDISPKDLHKLTSINANSDSHNDSPYHKFGWLRVSREYDLINSNNGINTLGNMVKGIASLIDPSNSNKNQIKRTKDAFFAVLKYNTLFVYDSERQLDCKGIIIVSNHDVTIFPEQLPDNEIYTKVNSIRLTKKPSVCADMALNLEKSNTDYYLFCDVGVEKEDWYFALQRSSKLESNASVLINNISQQNVNNNSNGKQINRDKSLFDPFAMNHLLKTLYSNEDHKQSQWLNAIFGRIFLSVYKTQAIKDYFIRKLIRKIKKVKKPGFLSDIQIRSVDVGDGIPYITNPRLVDLSQNGELNVDINLNYTGGFRVEIETEAIIETRLKTIKVPLVLAVVLRGLQGKMLLRIKSPPTNRLWMGFYEMPKLDLLIEPIVSETQLKFSLIINTIESKIHEMIMDSLVLPNMDDSPFFNSFGMGGIYEDIEKALPKAEEDEVESVTADILPSSKKEDSPSSIHSAPGKLESTKSDSIKGELNKVEATANMAEPITENNNTWTSRATRINKRLSALHESLSDPNLLKNTSRFRSIASASKNFIKQRTEDDSSTSTNTKEIVKESNDENLNNKDPVESTSSSTTNNSSTVQSSTSAFRRWSQSVGIRRRTSILTSNTTGNSSNNNNATSDNTTSNNASNNNENDAQSSNNSTEPIPITMSADSSTSRTLIENSAPLSSSPLSTSPNDVSLLISTTTSTTPTPPPSPKSPKTPTDIHSLHSLNLSSYSPINNITSYNRELFSENELLQDNEFFSDVSSSILNTPVEELNRVLG